MTMLPVLPGVPRSFRDPRYTELARIAEEKLGLPRGILDAIRIRGERSNADQVSPSGARTPYQFIPSTRRAFIKKYGLDPWLDDENATESAARHLLESKARTGSWDKAIAGYHGGIRAEHGRGGRINRNYVARVGSFDGDDNMPIPGSLFPVPYYGGVDPLAPLPELTALPERPRETAPVPGELGASVSTPSTAPHAERRRRGVLGALESIFMPDPDSRWASALRNGIYDAKAGQIAYKQGVQKSEIENQMAQAKLKNLLTKGEFQVVGNNVIHFPPDGSAPRYITPPATPGEKERLIEQWRNMSADDPAKELIKSMLLGANDEDVLAAKAAAAAEAARIRAGATTGAARIRADSATTKNSVPGIPEGWKVVK